MLQILIVDDEELAIERLARILKEIDDISSITSFLTPSEAYEYAKTHEIDVAFLDISMPDINGMMLSGLLKELNKNIDIVFVTGYDEFAVQAFNINALDYVMKPVKKERLMSTIERINRPQKYAAPSFSLEVCMFHDLTIKLPSSRGKMGEVKLRSPKTEELFAFLIYKRTVTREEIIDTLWPDMMQDKALKNLNSNLYYIRKALVGTNENNYIKTAGDEIRLETDDLYCDLYEFEEVMKELKRDSHRTDELIRKLEALYTGSFLRSKSYNWSIDHARQLELQYIEQLELTSSYFQEEGKLQPALYYYNELIKLDRIREDIHYKVIQLYIKLGRKHEALRQYTELEKILLEEMGTRPDAKVLEML